MSKITTVTTCCDICKREGAESHSFFFDRRMDAAGSMDNEYYNVDLCSIHFREIVRKCGDPKKYSWSVVGRPRAIRYGSDVKEWIEMQKIIWSRMSSSEWSLALQIEGLSTTHD